MFKKTIAIVLSLIMLLSISTVSVMAGTDGIKVIVNGKTLSFDQPPIVENGRTLVPLRAIFEALGAKVDWNESSQTVTAVKDDVTVTLKIGSDILVKNGVSIKLDVPAKAINGRTMVPARAVAESFGAEVGWNQDMQTVTIDLGQSKSEALPMNAPIDINGYTTSIIRTEIKDRINDNQPVAGKMVYVIHFEPGNTTKIDTFNPLFNDCELIDKAGNRYYANGSQFGNERYYNIQFSIPVDTEKSGFMLYWKGKKWVLTEATGVIPNTSGYESEPSSPSNPSNPTAYPTDFDVKIPNNHFQVYSLPGGNYVASVTYFIGGVDYNGELDYKVMLSDGSGVGNIKYDSFEIDAGNYVKMVFSFQVSPNSTGVTVNNKFTIQIGDWVYTDTLPVTGNLHSIKIAW